MIKIVDAETRAGKRELEILLKTRRGGSPDFATLKQVLPIVEDVLRRGKPALRKYVKRFDLPAARRNARVDEEFARAFRLARRRIEAYHRKQLSSVSPGLSFKDPLGVSFVERPVPFDSVGVYVPGGRAFYPSSLLMGVVPARVAGVRRIVVATPRGAWASSPELRWAAVELGVDDVLLAGGAHGIAGLVSVSGVAKIVGPGNRFVAAAKHLVSSLVGIDLPAGPSEVLIVASKDADPALVAADLLAQAEHDADAKCLLFSDSRVLATAVQDAIASQLEAFEETGSSKVMRAALRRGGRIFLFKETSRAVSFASAFAAEHVQVMGRRAERLSSSLLATAGALFIGPSTPTALGDYVLGPNHVLPTGGAARSFSGLSVRDFLRWGRSVAAPPKAARRLAREAAVLARFEGLAAHARSLDRRFR